MGEGQGCGGSRRRARRRRIWEEEKGPHRLEGRERWIWRELRKDLAREVRAGARDEGAPPPSARDPP